MTNHYSIPLADIINFSNEITDQLIINKDPRSLYDPINHILFNKGKQIRSVFALLTYDMFGGDINDLKQLILAIESLHNFTLIHDDVMDNAMLRRGSPTINTKWSNNQAILSGDVLLIKSYQHLLKSSIANNQILKNFTETAILICEGQQMDFDFQLKKALNQVEYFKMIELKTGVLITFSLLAPASLTNLGNDHTDIMKSIGNLLGQLFQIQDDYLDLYGQCSRVGKVIGGDVIEMKKTFLYVTACQNASPKKQAELEKIYHSNFNDKIDVVLQHYQDLGVQECVKDTINSFSKKLKNLVSSINVPIHKKQVFLEFLDIILSRKA